MLLEKKRLHYIDWAKAICIILIVLGHMLPKGCWPKVLAYAFHVPIFAIIGGVLLSAPKTWREYGKKCFGIVKRILIPYIIFFAICCAFYFLPQESIPQWVAKSATTEWKELLKYFTFYERKTVWNSALWFLPCYTVISFVFLTFSKLTKGNRVAALGLSLLSFVTLLQLEKREITINIGEVKDVFGMKNYFLMLGFFALGYALRPMLDLCAEAVENPRKNPMPYAAGAAFVMIGVACLKCNAVEITKSRPAGYYTISMYSGLYNDLFLFISFAVLLSITLMVALMLLPKSDLVALISRNSLFIMFSHLFFQLNSTYVEMKPAASMWELDMKLGFRDTAYIMIILVAFLWILDAILKRFPRIRKIFVIIGIQ